jgi:hypothetical protein
MFIFSQQIHLEHLKRTLSKDKAKQGPLCFTAKMERIFEQPKRLIGKGFGPEQGNIFYKHAFGKAPYNFLKISPPGPEKYCQDVGQVKRCCSTNRVEKGESCSYLIAMLNA